MKASGGIRTLADARAMLEAGASRIGASASVAILREYQGEVLMQVPPKEVSSLSTPKTGGPHLARFSRDVGFRCFSL